MVFPPNSPGETFACPTLRLLLVNRRADDGSLTLVDREIVFRDRTDHRWELVKGKTKIPVKSCEHAISEMESSDSASRGTHL